ncbi:MAG: hypothetical protein KDA65_05420 [Planctomycetaceae bacterium]|nr:hypothetical protein [Planctomycetaceae bacterium]
MTNRWLISTFWTFCSLVGFHWCLSSALFSQDLLEIPKDKQAARKAEEKEPKEQNTQKNIPLGRTITVESPVNDAIFGHIKNTASTLQIQAAQENRKAFLILEITPGDSPFHQVQGLAKFLTSDKVSAVTTVAWVPKTVTGNNAVLALACKEIIMHPDAELGDLGRGRALDQDEQRSLLSLIQKRLNPKVNEALLKGFMDPQVAVLKVNIEQGNNGVTSKVVTTTELKQLQNSGVTISDIETIKEAGTPGILTGTHARALDVLVSKIARERSDLVSIFNLPPEALRESLSVGGEQQAIRLKLNDVIEPVIGNYLFRQIDRAVKQGKNIIIIEIDSPGGYLKTSIDLADKLASLDSDKVLTVAYVPKQAISGAAIVALGCDQIYMHPSALIGDAGPIEMRQGQVMERAPEKVIGPIRAKLKELAHKKGRPAAVAEAMTDRKLPVFEVRNRETGQLWYMTQQEIDAEGGKWIQGPQIPESGQEDNDKLLTVESERAHELKLTEPPVQNLEDLKERLGISVEEELKPLEKTWLDTMIFVLNSNTAHFLLIVAGLVLIYVEANFVSGFFGTLSALCFILYFWSAFLGGTAGWLEVILFLFSVALLLVEAFVLPGFGVFGITGIILMFTSLIMATMTLGEATWGDTESNFSRISSSFMLIAGALTTVIVLAVIFNLMLPRIPFVRELIKPPAFDGPGGYSTDEPHLHPDLVPHADLEEGNFVGKRATTFTALRPAGKIKLDGEVLNVVSNGAYIPPGTEVEIIERSGNHIVVREIS